MYKKLISSLFLVVFSVTLRAESFFDQIEAHLLDLQQQMNEFAHAQPNTILNSAISETKDGLTVTISGIDAEELLANINDDDKSLIIEAQGATVAIKTAGTYISVHCKQEVSSDKNKESKQIFYSSSSSQTARNCSHPIDLEKQMIQYDKDKKELCITFAFQEKKMREVPIQIVQSTQDKTSNGSEEVELS